MHLTTINSQNILHQDYEIYSFCSLGKYKENDTISCFFYSFKSVIVCLLCNAYFTHHTKGFVR